MKQDRYDEFQIAKRHRLGFQAFFLTIALIVANGIIKMNYIWAEPLMEMLVLMYIPLTYLTAAMIWKGAYTSKKVKNPNVYIPMFGLVVLFNWFVIGQSIWSGVFVIVEDGMLATSSGILFTTIFFTLATIAMIMRRAADLRMLRAES
ncbi:hypothetical protein MHZ95_15500 [Sporosarcina sp. ACRSM]|uniref:hypothetical protein n=1 Tax=Sporosarcina sp. ACRSM TaxID=2918216 RepID=UPI001EF5FAFB|nr:hypothetical protein [Sporosarcina sp. ACRSM]MCG7336671.1 hypothetical protein [Sporosarcina sp. ACRSM]